MEKMVVGYWVREKKVNSIFFFTDFKFKQLIGFLMNFQAVHVYSP